MDKVAVRKAVGVQYPVTGAPILVTGGGGRGRGAVGVTRGQRALGALGMLAGAAGALTGQHRSLGGLVQSAISGGAQGSALGRGIGRGLTTRRGQARADMDEETRQAYARRHVEQGRGRFRGLDNFQFRQRTPEGMRGQLQVSDARQAAAIRQAELAQKLAEQQAMRRQQEGFADLERDAAAARQFMDMTGATLQDVNTAAAQMGAAEGETTRVEPTEVRVRPPVVNAAGHPVPPEEAAAIPQLGQGGAVDEINTIEATGKKEAELTGTDHDRRRTVAVTPSRPMEEDENEDPQSSTSRAAMLQGMMGRPQPQQPVDKTVQQRFVGVD